MRSVNKVILVGNLTRDPELKSTTGGQAICSFGLATNRQWKDQEGQQHDLAEFHEITAWSKRAEICHQILKKGNLVYIEGYIKTRSWLDEETKKKRFRTEVIIDDVIKLDKRPIDNTTVATPAVAHAQPAAIQNDTVGASAVDAFGGTKTTEPSVKENAESSIEANADQSKPIFEENKEPTTEANTEENKENF
jgi:single-strand DNA-binding protein